MEDLVRLVALLDRDLAFVVVAKEELGLHIAADGLDGAGGQHPLGGPARTHHAVDPGPGLEGRLERPRDVAGGDELDASPNVADLSYHLLVAITFEDHDRQLLHR